LEIFNTFNFFSTKLRSVPSLLPISITFFVSSISKEESRKHLDKMLFHEASPANGHLYDVNLIATVVNKFLQDSTKGSGILGATTTGDFGS
jgi:hypothetical protein